MRFIVRALILSGVLILSTPSLWAQSPQPDEPQINLLFRDQFYLTPSQKIYFNTLAADDFQLVERSSPEWNSNIAVVSGFGARALRTRVLRDIQSVEQAKEWIQKQKKTASFEGVSISELPLKLANGQTEEVYWVGHRGFRSFDEAAAEVAMVKSIIEAQGGDFRRALGLSEEFMEPEQVTPSEAAQIQSQTEKEEKIALRWLDHLEIGEKLYGPFQGTPSGEQILYQSFGETTFRTTNLAERKFNSQVGFWTNRLVFKGIWFPINTVDPFVEITGALESSPNDGGSQLDTVAGLEWRPFARNAGLENFRPNGIPYLKWIKNYRFYVQYLDRRNLKDEIANIHDEDFRVGMDIFYEWGIEVSSLGEKGGRGIPGFLRDTVWGEYFGNYGWRKTNFTTHKSFDSFLLDTSLLLGLKTPSFKLPQNPFLEEFGLMPYLHFGLIANTEFSNPADNRYFLGLGLRWMPFRSAQYQNNEWLAKTKIFAEWLGIGKVQNLKQDNSRPHPDEDWRLGVAFSLRRF